MLLVLYRLLHCCPLSHSGLSLVGFFLFGFGFFFSGNASSGYLYFFCFETYPCVLDLSAFLVFVLLNSMVSGSECLSDLISFES